jgi:hypothetical protein
VYAKKMSSLLNSDEPIRQAKKFPSEVGYVFNTGIVFSVHWSFLLSTDPSVVSKNRMQ